MPILETSAAQDALRRYRRVAVLGAHPSPDKPAHYVPRYLAQAGYDLYPVNPAHAGETLFGKPVAASLAELPVPIDIVNVFRRSEHLPEHAEEILAMKPLPKLVWLQQGVRHDRVARRLAEAGLEVVQDRCILLDHQRLSAE